MIGGSADGAGNVIGGNDSYGINLAMWASNNLIQGNWIGTDETGTTALNNSIGIYMGGPDNQIGGAGAGEGNWICGNTYGSRVIGSYGVRAVIEGNSVGLGAGGVPVPNEYGVQLFTASNRVGSTVVNGGNLIAANATTGIEISGSDSFGNEILGNRIGEDGGNGRYGISVRSPGTVVGGLGAGAGNIVTSNEWDGILLSGADAVGCRVEGNLVAYNGDAGIQVLDSGSVSNLISQNSIFLNGKLGIDIGNTGVTTNDPGDGDAGANGLQNFPVLTLASNAGATLAIGGYLDSSPGEEFMIEFFDSPECDSSGYGEGATYLGQQIVNTDGGGMASFTNAAIPAPAIPPSFVTATARRTASKETSEFSRYLLVDSDGDGMPDGWEFIYFGSTTGAAPDGHGDGDPFTNLEEFIADTDPTDGDDYPRFAGIVNEGDWIRVDMETAPSRMYRLEDQDAADDDAWASRLTDLEGTGGVVSWIWVYSDTTTVFRCWAYLP